MPSSGRRSDPATSYKFHVQVGSISEAAFAECSGLQAEVLVEEYTQGGANDMVYKLPGRARFSNVTLRRGVCYSDELWNWWKATLFGQVVRKNVTIVLYDQKGETIVQWTLVDAFPVKWVGPQLRASDNTPAVEALELAFQQVLL